jgi:hypothetical protein
VVPQLVILDLPDTFKQLSDTLYSHGYKDHWLEKAMTEIIRRLRHRSEAYIELSEYVEKIEHENGEYVAKRIDIIGRDLYHKLLDHQAYLPEGVTPYEYSGRQGFEFLILEFDHLYRLNS